MLVLNRRVGQTICIGDDVCVTVYDKLRYHVTMGVISPADAQVSFGQVYLRPAILPDGERFYMFSLLSSERFRIDDVELQVGFTPSYLGIAIRKRQVRIAIAAPPSVAVDREEIRLQRLERDSKRRPSMPFAT